MRNTRKSGQILRSKKRPRPTPRSGRRSRTSSNTSHQIPARVIEADSARAVRVPDPRSVQLIQPGAAAAVITVRSIGSLPTAGLAAQESIIASIAVARLPSCILPCNNQHSRWTRLEKVCHVNDHKSANRVGVAVFSSGQLSLKLRQQRLGGEHVRSSDIAGSGKFGLHQLRLENSQAWP